MTATPDLSRDPRFTPIAGIPRTPDDVRLHRLAEGAWILRLPLPYPPTPALNAYLFATGDGYVLVDCGTALPPGWECLVSALTQIGVRPDELRLLVTTHPHTDHAALAATVVERTGCSYARFDGPLAQLERLRDHWIPIEARRRITRECGVPEDVLETWIEAHMAGDGDAWPPEPDRLLRAGDTIETAVGAWMVLSAAGHSSSMLMLWNADRRWLISADLILHTPFQFFEWGHLDDPYTAHLDSLRRALALGPDLLLPGHGRPVHQHIGERIRFSIDATIAERDRVLELIDGKPQTPYAISSTFAPAEADLDYRQASLSVVLSLVDHLSSQGLVESWTEDGLRQVRRSG